MTTESQDILGGLNIDETGREHLRTAAVWARIIAIVAFISIGINLLVTFGAKTETAATGFPLMDNRNIQIVWSLISVAVSLMINLFLLRFASNSKMGVDRLDQPALESGINGLASYFKFTVIGICITVVAGIILAVYSMSLSQVN